MWRSRPESLSDELRSRRTGLLVRNHDPRRWRTERTNGRMNQWGDAVEGSANEFRIWTNFPSRNESTNETLDQAGSRFSSGRTYVELSVSDGDDGGGGDGRQYEEIVVCRSISVLDVSVCLFIQTRVLRCISFSRSLFHPPVVFFLVHSLTRRRTSKGR